MNGFHWSCGCGGREIVVVVVTVGLVCLLASASATVQADEPEHSPQIPADLTELAIEDLMNVEVTSASKKAEKLSEAAAAIFVITQEDIRRSGATSIPEVLRMVPGVQVARRDANKWAVSARGFNDQFANKLLVLMDGRTVYTPLFSGVFWDVQDTMLEDIDRIEVIRGPGGTLWGANAVNGVINIITKKAEDTQGTLVTTTLGTEEKGLVGVRHGGVLGDSGHYRTYAKWFDRDDSSGGWDRWEMARAGFRADWDLGERDTLTAQGDYYDGRVGERGTRTFLTPPFSETLDAKQGVSGGNVLLRWKRELCEDSDLSVQLYYDHTDRSRPLLSDEHDTFDLDFQHRFAVGDGHDVVWGIGYRLIDSETDGSFTFSLDPPNETRSLVSAFIQDEISLVPNRLDLTVGSKFEHHHCTGVEVQPSARVAWRPSDDAAVWTAVSRAVRVPSHSEQDARMNASAFEAPGMGLSLVSVFGNEDLGSEEVTSYELGYRTRATDRLFVDIASFHNRYDHLRSVEPGEPFFETSPAPPHMVLPSYFDNKKSGETYGVEVSAEWQATDSWRLDAAYSFLRTDLHLAEDSGDTQSMQEEGQSPRHQFSLRSMTDLSDELELDWWLRYVDALPSLDVGSYVTMDVRLGWQPAENVELSLVGQNLLDSSVPQFAPSYQTGATSPVERGVYAKATWRF